MTKAEMGDGSSYRRFWTELLAQPKAVAELHLPFKAREDWFIQAPGGAPGLAYNLALRKHDAYVELWIDLGDEPRNEEQFLALQRQRGRIESVFGGLLTWHRARGGTKRSRALQYFLRGGGFDDPVAWPGIQRQLLDAVIRLHHAIGPLIGN